MNAYLFVLYLHSYLRWGVLAFAAITCAIGAAGWVREREWTRVHERLHVAFVATIDLQFTLGALLYLWLSPYVRAFYAAPGSAMKEATLRFFGVEHVFSMLIAVSIIHIARARSKRLAGPLRYRRVLLSTLAAVLLILIAIPWPFLPYGRPLLR